jgi:uncharacterized phage-like protein YoqJ
MILAGTGHRPDKLGGYGALVQRRLIEIARIALMEYKPAVVISGMALGWDQALARAAVDVGIEWWAYVPCTGQEKRWPPTSQVLYRELLHSAKMVKYVTMGPFTETCLQKRNEAMVNDCHRLMALWNGTRGGTWNCIQYATMRHRPIINLWKKFQS